MYAAGGGGGGWDAADADARALGVCDQHRPSEPPIIQPFGLIRAAHWFGLCLTKREAAIRRTTLELKGGNNGFYSSLFSWPVTDTGGLTLRGRKKKEKRNEDIKLDYKSRINLIPKGQNQHFFFSYGFKRLNSLSCQLASELIL